MFHFKTGGLSEIFCKAEPCRMHSQAEPWNEQYLLLVPRLRLGMHHKRLCLVFQLKTGGLSEISCKAEPWNEQHFEFYDIYV
ncbi:hypothetical protein QUF80_20350 [Desulfococcaceae bacterium HSG8]|nr:hypothetical protein [Desulfococcaceae bacterium HSG8]